MKNTLSFSITIQAPRHVVWENMLGAEGYARWTSAFCEGSHFTGSWDQGASIRFLAPNGDGMVAEIAQNRLHEFVSIRHLGEISGGVEDTTSDKVRGWAPAYENFELTDADGGTRVLVTIDTVAEFEQYMLTTYPKALESLKQLCEGQAPRQ